MTTQERIDQLEAVPEVLAAWIERAAVSIPQAGEIYKGRLAWAYLNNGVVRLDGHDIIVVNSGLVENGVNVEQAYWLNQVPDILKPAEPDAYITGRTQPFTKAEVESFCNAQWRATSGNAAARDVIEFSVSNVTANTVRVSGLFHDVATNNRIKLTYLISLVDANGAATAPNVKFEKVIE